MEGATLDELIAVLEGMRREHGGRTPVRVECGEAEAYAVQSVHTADWVARVIGEPLVVYLDTTG